MNRTRIGIIALVLFVIPVLAFAQSNTTGNQRVTPAYQVTITSNVSNADIYINGQLQRETTPATISLRRGSYDIRVEARGYLPWSTTLAVSSRTSIHAQLLRPYATLILSVPREFINDDVRNPLGMVSFYIDGQLQRGGRVQVDAGRHRVTITSGGLRLESDVYFEGGVTYTLEPVLRLNLLQTPQGR